MSAMKPEVSVKNPSHLSKHRYYELKHFCLQYPDWQKQLKMLDSPRTPEFTERVRKSTALPNPTEYIGIRRAALSRNIRLIEDAAKNTDRELAPYILKGVTDGCGFEKLEAEGIPCGRDMYYDRYRKFFALLSEAKG